MHRLAIRILGLSLCAGALGGCGMTDGTREDSASAANSPRAAAASPMAPDIDSNIRQAQLLRLNGDLPGATKILSQLMLVYPDDPRVVGEYGKLLVQKNANADAVDFLRRAIELQPSDWTLYSALGVAFDQENDQASARIVYERALQMRPNEPALLNNYAMSRMLAGDTAMARTLLMQARAAGSTDPKIAANLAMLDRNAPPPGAVAVPSPALAMTPRRSTVAHADLPPPVHAPLALGRSGNPQVVMQDVPVDPLAGPVGRNAHGKPAPRKLAKAGHPAPRVAATRPARTSKPANGIPALRMTADASKP